LLCISAAVIYTMSNIQLKLKKKYPQVDCKDIYKIFHEDYIPGDPDVGNFTTADLKDKSDIKNFMQEAVREYITNLPKENETVYNSYQGTMECWCKYMDTVS
jgi:hypothetical protein